MTKNINKNLENKIAKMSFEDAMARLEQIAEILSSKQINLDQMIELYEESDLLKKHCFVRLEDAKMKIDVIKNNSAA